MRNLSKETIKNIEEIIGINIDETINLSSDDEIGYVDKKTDNLLKFSKNARVDGMCIRTMEEVDEGIDRIIKYDDIFKYIMIQLKVKKYINLIKVKLLSELSTSELSDADEISKNIIDAKKIEKKLKNENNYKVKTKKRGCNKNE